MLVAHIAAELFKWQAGVNMVHVPYRGAMLGLTDVIAGHVDLMFTDLGNSSGSPVPAKREGCGQHHAARRQVSEYFRRFDVFPD